jgi:predicted DNA repair protein MutK
LGDDLALNAQQVSGISADRELPVVWAVCKGSLVNKLILVPAALLISILMPSAITPLLMLGGAYLCFEGFEKLAHKLLHNKSDDQAHAESLRLALTDPNINLLDLERDKIKGAVRTDFILSAEIIAITLGTVQQSPWPTQLTVLSAIAFVMTIGVYGFVAAIVKLDDVGLHLSAKPGAGVWTQLQRALGDGLLRAAPWLMKTLAVVGTAAMFLVGGGILVHGIGPLHHAIPELLAAVTTTPWVQTTISTAIDGLVGIVAGGLVLLLLTGFQRVRAGMRT